MWGWNTVLPNGLEVYLQDRGTVPGIGSEKGRRVTDGIAKYVSPHGSARYVEYSNGVPIGALQVVSRDRRTAIVANVYVSPEYRRHGVASRLLRRARRDFDVVEHASPAMQSEDARAWIGAVK